MAHGGETPSTPRSAGRGYKLRPCVAPPMYSVPKMPSLTPFADPTPSQFWDDEELPLNHTLVSQYKALGEECGLKGLELAEFAATQVRQQTMGMDFSRGTPSVPTPIKVVIPPSQKVRKFWGQANLDKDYTVEDFIESIDSLVLGQGGDEDARVRTVLSHLEGEARREVKSCGTVCNAVKDIYSVLRKAFGDTRSLPSAYREFATLSQGHRQTVREFANELYLRFAVVQTKQREQRREVSTSEVLTDQFCEGVRDRTLAMELLKMVRGGKSSFSELRDFAIEWEHIITPSAGSKSAGVHQVQLGGDAGVKQLDSRLDDIERRMSQLRVPAPDRAKAKQGNEEQRDRYRKTNNYRYASDGRPICAYCGETGHIRWYCQSRSKQVPLNPDPSA